LGKCKSAKGEKSEKERSMYNTGVTFWVDHYSQFVYLTIHENKKAEELLQSKLEFEEFALKHGVNIKKIRADNRVYTAKNIQDSLI
jgi:hypothetical protein